MDQAKFYQQQAKKHYNIKIFTMLKDGEETVLTDRECNEAILAYLRREYGFSQDPESETKVCKLFCEFDRMDDMYKFFKEEIEDYYGGRIE